MFFIQWMQKADKFPDVFLCLVHLTKPQHFTTRRSYCVSRFQWHRAHKVGQGRGNKDDWGLEHLLWGKAEGFGSLLEKRRLTWNISKVYKYLNPGGGCQEDIARLCPVMLSNRARGKGRNWCSGSSTRTGGRNSLVWSFPQRTYPRTVQTQSCAVCCGMALSRELGPDNPRSPQPEPSCVQRCHPCRNWNPSTRKLKPTGHAGGVCCPSNEHTLEPHPGPNRDTKSPWALGINRAARARRCPVRAPAAADAFPPRRR